VLFIHKFISYHRVWTEDGAARPNHGSDSSPWTCLGSDIAPWQCHCCRCCRRGGGRPCGATALWPSRRHWSSGIPNGYLDDALEDGGMDQIIIDDGGVDQIIVEDGGTDRKHDEEEDL
jgi:hypothetical protein